MRHPVPPAGQLGRQVDRVSQQALRGHVHGAHAAAPSIGGARRCPTDWAAGSGLWQKTEDYNGIKGGWVDWVEPTYPAEWWLRFIDTSFYAISIMNGGYYFGTDN